MKKYLTAALLCASSISYSDSFADPRKAEGEYPDNPFYGFVGSGYGWTLKPGIDNPNPSEWDSSVQGYDGSLGQSPFFTIGFGRQFFEFLHTDVSYTYYQTFHYQKYQTGISSTPDFTGAHRVRFFDLDHQNVLFNLSLYPWTLHLGCLGFTPFAGAGIGVGFNRVTNFYTVGFSDGVGSTSSIGQASTRAVFAWQASAGIRLQPRIQHLSFDVGYRYYAGGEFTGPRTVVVEPTGSLSSGNTPWTGDLKINELYFNLSLAY